MTSASINAIGTTSLMTAQLRAWETERPDAIIDDPWAGRFVAAAGSVLPPGAEEFIAHMREQLAVRTRFLDDALLAATRAGCGQVVLVAAGMDARAFRLDWPAGTTVFEVDQGAVLDFKDGAVERQGGVARCDRRPVAADLREDWTSALSAAGFDATRPTAWLTEGLLYSLDQHGADRLLAAITAASAPASSLAFDHMEAAPGFVRALHAIGPDLAALWQSGPRDPESWLRAQGWVPCVRELADEAARYARPVPAGFDPSRPGSVHSWLVTAGR